MGDNVIPLADLRYAAATPRFVPSLKRLGLSLGLVRPTQKH